MNPVAHATAEPAIPAWVDGRLVPVGKMEAHRRGLRHKAVSVFVMRGGRTLLQRRAAVKYHSPGLWANACCTHPLWIGAGAVGPVMDTTTENAIQAEIEDGATCAARRLREELGIADLALRPGPVVEYRADVGAGLVEHEVVEVFLVDAPADLTMAPNPEEVSEVDWVPLEALARDVEAHPDRYAPWLRIYVTEHLDRIFGEAAPG